jgi:hypothetical protein
VTRRWNARFRAYQAAWYQRNKLRLKLKRAGIVT